MAGGLFWTSSSRRLTAAEAFATLSVVALVSSPLQVLLNAFPQFMSLSSCFSRLQKFLLLDDQVDQRNSSDASLPVSRTESPSSDVELNTIKSVHQGHHYQPILARFINASLAVPGRTEPVLKDLNISIRRAGLTLILGPVGSGKTSLLRTLLGEMTIISGCVRMEDADAAYCDQTSWLRNISIRDNILGHTAFDPKWYRNVLHACLLEEDLSQLPNGDGSLVGSGGMNVSGGQRQRIVRCVCCLVCIFYLHVDFLFLWQVLARALYSGKRILILDDIFSALDAGTGQAIFRNLFGRNGLVRRSNITTVLATHLCRPIPLSGQFIIHVLPR